MGRHKKEQDREIEPFTQTHYDADCEPVVYHVPQFREGMRFGMLTLIEQFDEENAFGRRVHRGLWHAKCDCGEKVVVHRNALKSGKPRGRACYHCRSEVPRMRMGHPPNDYAGKIIGRLAIGEWVPGEGWMCACKECEEIVMVRYSSQLGTASMRPCGQPCGGDSVFDRMREDARR